MPIDYNKRPSGAAGQPTGAPVSLSKVTLTKSAPQVSLSKHGAARGRLRVNLNWNSRPAGAGGGGGLFKRLAGGGSSSIDLDLGCLWELRDGSKGVVQALGNAFGSLDRPPYIMLDKDDRSGTSTDGENLFVNLDHSAEVRRVLVFAFIYEGVARFDQADGVVTLHPVAGPPVEVRLDEAAGDARMCAIAMLESSGDELVVRREIRYLNGGQSQLDKAYGWGMDWSPGRK